MRLSTLIVHFIVPLFIYQNMKVITFDFAYIFGLLNPKFPNNKKRKEVRVFVYQVHD